MSLLTCQDVTLARRPAGQTGNVAALECFTPVFVFPILLAA
jgi:hypothetical protein